MDRKICCGLGVRALILCAAAYAYFVLYPGDIEALASPLVALTGAAGDVIGNLAAVSTKFSLGFWVFASACVVVWGGTKIWRRR